MAEQGRGAAAGKLSRGARRAGDQGLRIVLLVAIVAITGMAVGYAVGYPLRFVDYEPSSAVALDQASLAGTVEVTEALVAAEDLGATWAPGDPAVAAFGVLGADVCGEAIDTPTPLSAKEAAVWSDGTNGARIISQALRVDRWKGAEEYIDDVAEVLEDCDTFFVSDGAETVKVTSSAVDRDPPVTDHVDRRNQSPNGVQEWSMMAVGDVIVAVQYLAATPPPEGFLDEIERSILARTVPSEFAPGGVDPLGDDPLGDDGSEATPGATGAPDTGAPETSAPDTNAPEGSGGP